jgi:YggT family protein
VVLDVVSYAQQFIDVFVWIYLIAIFLWVLSSWVRVPYSLQPVQRFLHDICDPYLRLWRRVLPFPAGPIDFTPIAAIFGLYVFRALVDALLSRLH